MKKRIIDEHTPFATIYPLGGGRYAMNAQNGIACTLTGARHYTGNITNPRQGFREMGVLEIIKDMQDDNFVECLDAMSGCTAKCLDDCNRCHFTSTHWICEEKIPIPQTNDGCAHAITATYANASFANMVTTAHFPRMGIIEIGHYEQ